MPDNSCSFPSLVSNKASGDPAQQVSENAFSHLPDAAIRVVDILETGGFEAWFVGGFVRDALLGRPCSDIDIASNASWQQAQALFEAAGFKTHETGVAHGTLTVLVGNEAFEVTTYRRDGAYSDSRHPSSVEFVSSIEEDLARRDFTMNAIAFHPLRGLLDPYGGVDDLQAKTIRAVGDPAKRFSEDALRILRACRFAAQLGFDIEDETLFGMLSNKGIVYRVSAERVTYELDRLLTAPFAGSALVKYVDVLSCVLPELVSMKGVRAAHSLSYLRCARAYGACRRRRARRPPRALGGSLSRYGETGLLLFREKRRRPLLWARERERHDRARHHVET